MTTVTHKLERLVFSGKNDDFAVFQEHFEARMFTLKLQDTLLDKIKTPERTDPEEAAETQTRVAAEAARDLLRYHLWCELIQCLERKNVMFIRSHKPNGLAAWKALKQYYKSSERPRIHATMAKLTSIQMTSGESISDYLTRAEDLQMDLTDVGEQISESLFVAMILKGLTRDYDAIVTLLTHGEKKSLDEMKQDLVNFANSKGAGDHRPA